MAGMCRSKFVEHQRRRAAPSHSECSSRQHLAHDQPPFVMRCSARAERRAHIEPHGLPDGASAEWGQRKSSASPTTGTWRRCRGIDSRRRATRTHDNPDRRLPPTKPSRGEPHAERLQRAGVLTTARGKGDSAGHDHARQIPQAGDRHQHRGQTLVARRDASTPARNGSERASRRKITAASFRYGQTVEHPGRPLRAAIAGIGTKTGEGNGLQPAKFLRRGLDQQADLPMPV